MTLPEVALSIQQPWAWCIVNGYKPIENRDWWTSFRGPFLVHAGKKFDELGYEWIYSEFPGIPMPPRGAFECGGIVGRATLTDCVTEHRSAWFVGDYGFVLEDGQPLPFMPCRGMLGFFKPAIEAPSR